MPASPRSRPRPGLIVALAVLAPIIVAGLLAGVAWWWIDRQPVEDSSIEPAPPVPQEDCKVADGFPGLEEMLIYSSLVVEEQDDWRAVLVHPETRRRLEMNAVDFCNGYHLQEVDLETPAGPVAGLRIRRSLASLPAWLAVPDSWEAIYVDVTADGRYGVGEFVVPTPETEASDRVVVQLQQALSASGQDVRREGNVLSTRDRRRVELRYIHKTSAYVVTATFSEETG